MGITCGMTLMQWQVRGTLVAGHAQSSIRPVPCAALSPWDTDSSQSRHLPPARAEEAGLSFPVSSPRPVFLDEEPTIPAAGRCSCGIGDEMPFLSLLRSTDVIRPPETRALASTEMCGHTAELGVPDPPGVAWILTACVCRGVSCHRTSGHPRAGAEAEGGAS